MAASNVIELLEKLIKIFKEEQVFDQTGDRPVMQFLHPKALQKEISFSLDNEPASDEQIEDTIRQVIRRSIKTFSPDFHNKFYRGLDEYGLIGSYLTEILNTSIDIYENAPVFTVIEEVLIQASSKLMGYPFRSDGIMTPNATVSIMYAMMAAKQASLSNIKQGLHKHISLACITSECGYLSIMTAAHWLGFGTQHVYTVKTDKFGRMDIRNLKKVLKQTSEEMGSIPFFINVSAGTPVFGAIDPLRKIIKICKEWDIWIHVDARDCGSLMFSKLFRRRLQGIERSSSISWNPHNMLGAPYHCNMILMQSQFERSTHSYLRTVINEERQYTLMYHSNTNFKSLQSSRKADAMKFWLMWKARGMSGLQQLVEEAMWCAKYLLIKINKTDGFRSVLEQYDSTTICFWYIPPSMRHAKETPFWWKKIYIVTAVIQKRLILNGSLIIDYASLPQSNLGNFFRVMVKCYPLPTRMSMDYILNQIEKAGADL
ncbi:PREDICTED: acidic amino acid decarboxylase GADL1-like [Acromyrmex echinatior]|uniref:Glutamate decarboxylase-like protein 1 n=1 Tax=Acromyrmex echinatior TaxID=103372 RepID=F4W962_ACREC|nr:PREDICTED: acidic amino acid decarboxylase GADL1-like [Acromyrmex echinatior]EGI69244.1 Glutamate decarboxylase-like protein 1 [Acromyrmex echinatior]